jgi:hypothetical protein
MTLQVLDRCLGVLKYFNDYNITPKCNLRFISHGGHEAGVRGSLSHVFNESNWPVLENSSMIINIDQIGHHFQNASFRINATNYSWIPALWTLTEDALYNETYQEKNYWVKIGKEHSDDYGVVDAKIYNYDYRMGKYKGVFFDNLEDIDLDYIEFCKDNFPEYHRTGNNHTSGDTLDVLDQDDINATVDIILNTLKYFAVNPDCWFYNDSITFFDSPLDRDSLNDSVRFNFTINTSLPHDLTMIDAYLGKSGEKVDRQKSIIRLLLMV